LTQECVPATIFLVSDVVGTEYSFWPNDLAALLAQGDSSTVTLLPTWLRQLVEAVRGDAQSGLLSAAQIDSIITDCKSSRSDADMREIVRKLGQSVAAKSAERNLMSWAEIKEMQASELVRFGSHTRNHTRLTGSITAATLSDEVLGARDVIHQRLGVLPRTFCYPNGDTSPEAIAVVRSGYLGAVTTARGWNEGHSDRFVLERVGVHEDVSNTHSAFLSRLAGIG